jgi:hypothetical protein
MAHGALQLHGTMHAVPAIRQHKQGPVCCHKYRQHSSWQAPVLSTPQQPQHKQLQDPMQLVQELPTRLKPRRQHHQQLQQQQQEMLIVLMVLRRNSCSLKQQRQAGGCPRKPSSSTQP